MANNTKTFCKVFAPATVANVACGFDIMGFAIDEPGDIIIARKTDIAGVTIKLITGDEGRLPLDASKNTASVAVCMLLEKYNLTHLGFELEVHKQMPLGSGLGSSAASSVGALAAVNQLLDTPLSNAELLPFAMEGERIACGSAHADNVAASLFGGFVLIRSNNPVDVIELPTPSELFCTVVHPKLELRTEDSRKVLRKELKLELAIQQWANVGGLVSALYSNDYELISRSLKDVVIEPVRKALIPAFDQVKEAALNAGALGGSISGAGPSIFVLCKGKDIADRAGQAMAKAFKAIDVDTDVFVSQVNKNGPKILELN